MKVYLKVTPQSVRYAMIDVRGDRVEKGHVGLSARRPLPQQLLTSSMRALRRWKSMRALNAAELLYIQNDLRIMKGSTAFYVFQKQR